MAIGVALTLTGAGLLRSRRSLAVLSAFLVILTAGYFAVSLAVVPHLSLRRHGTVRLHWQVVAVAIVLVLVALLQLIAALSRVPVTWKRTISDRSVSPLTLDDDVPYPHEMIEIHARRRWAEPVLWSTVGVAAVAAISVWAWPIFGPRLVLAEVFPSDVTPLAHLTQLSSNVLTDVTPLLDLPSLTGVDLQGADPDKTIGLDELKARNTYVGMKGR
jgi:hypothetical protein